MRSERPKPIHLLCGRPMLSYVLDGISEAGATHAVVVTGQMGDRISKRILEDPPMVPLAFVEQRFDRGDADAALIGLTGFDDFEDEGDVLVVPADLPLMEVQALRVLLETHRSSESVCTVMSALVDDPAGRPIVTRDRHGAVAGLVRPSATDHSGSSAANGGDGTSVEVGLGVYCIRRGLLAPAVRRTSPDELDGLHRLADVVAVLADSGHPVASAPVVAGPDLMPVENRQQLADAEAELRRRTNARWLDRGVTMVDPSRTYIDATVRLGIDVTLFPGTMLQGTTVIGDGCEIGPDTRIDRCVIGRETVVEKTMARLAVIGDHCRIGPFAVVEPGSELSDGTVTGPFYAARTDAS
jgi:bifunctional UDP-N-acetylglucosamine pyrophosphorylase / glucosamine-1-phosphate N-acetyltransferase